MPVSLRYVQYARRSRLFSSFGSERNRPFNHLTFVQSKSPMRSLKNGLVGELMQCGSEPLNSTEEACPTVMGVVGYSENTRVKVGESYHDRLEEVARGDVSE